MVIEADKLRDALEEARPYIDSEVDLHPAWRKGQALDDLADAAEAAIQRLETQDVVELLARCRERWGHRFSLRPGKHGGWHADVHEYRHAYRPDGPAAALLSLLDEDDEAMGNLNTCPRCGGPADNGHSREDPPEPYVCTGCQAKDEQDALRRLDAIDSKEDSNT